MRILPKQQDILKQKNDERKRDIDEGVKLASAVDALREQLQTEKKNLIDWREANIRKVHEEIAEQTEARDKLKRENEEARNTRNELLKPLNKEWAEVNRTKAQLIEEKQEIYLSGEQLKIAEQKLKTQEYDISIIVSKVKRNEEETEKIKSEAISLKEMAQREYEIAQDERRTQTEAMEKALLEVSQRKNEYEVALQTIEVREQEVHEKEAELLLDRKHLESQQNALRIAREVINK